MISVQGVSYRYRGASQDALDQLDLTIARGELFGLLGPNGAGKSTLISLLTGLRRQRCGRIAIAGTDMNGRGAEQAAVRRRIAWVPQEYAFYPAMTVMENLRFFARAQGLESAVISERIDESLRITDLGEVRHRRAAAFSGGLKRRLNVAIGLLASPEYLFLDEPTVGIDPHSRNFILEFIRDINAAGTTIIYSSHYMEEVEALCDRIAIIDRGRLLKTGSLLQLLASERTNLATIALQQALPADAVLPEGVSLAADGLSLSAPCPQPQSLATLLQQLADSGIEINRLDLGSGNLEQLFLRLTDRSLKDH